MSKDFKLYERDHISFGHKFITLMDLLVSNKSTSRMECIILISVSHIQIISGIFSNNVGLFNDSQGVPDSYLVQFKNIIRLKDLFVENTNTFELIMYMILTILFLITIFFLKILISTNKNAFYTYKEMILNTTFKIFIYFLFTPILDMSLSILCFDKVNVNKCYVGGSSIMTVICLFVFLYSISIAFLLSIFYNDSMMLSNSYFSRISCNYEIYFTLNSIIYSLLLNLEVYLGPLIFIIYNLIISILFARLIFEKYPFYDEYTSFTVGTLHLIYVWTSIFSIIFFYIEVKQKSYIYISGVIITIFLYNNLKKRLEDKIILETPFHKLSNKFYFLFYIKSLLWKINNIENVVEDKAQCIGIVNLHSLECPLNECLTKKKDKPSLYLPVTEEWTQKNKNEINDKVYMLNFVTFVFNFYIQQNYFSADMLMNISNYYLMIIGNYCQAMMYNKKVSDLKLSYQEKFYYMRTKLLIRKALIEKLRPSNENCTNLEEVNTTMYFKYDDLSQKFFEEITSDVNLNLEFWKLFKSAKESNNRLDFNTVFLLTDKIRLTKNKISQIWKNLFETYNGFNDLFDLYENYVQQIIDDDQLRRELESLKNKIFINNEHYGAKNMYKILFDKDTGIIIASGDKGKEGMIEKVNEQVEIFFEYKEEELKGMSINFLMPKIFEKSHRGFMERYTNIGEKRTIDRCLRTYGKNKRNSLVPLALRVKLFPMLGDYICFCAMIIKENYDDIILLDNRFNIQGMSQHLIDKFNLNDQIFQDCDVPFYLICPNFINFYRDFINRDKQTDNLSPLELQKIEQTINSITLKKDVDDNKEKNYLENFEVNENEELEFEIAIPFLLKSYESNKNRKDKAFSYTMIRSGSNSENEDPLGINQINAVHSNPPNHIDVITEKSREDEENYEENQNLMNEQNESYNDKASLSKMLALEEDKEFQNKLNYYRNFFDKKQFNFLDSAVKRLNLETKENDSFKFFFAFKTNKFGDGQISFVIRCIDNKQEEGSLSSDNMMEPKKLEGNNLENVIPMNSKNNNEELAHNTAMNEFRFSRNKNLTSLRENYEFTKVEIDDINSVQKNYYFKCLEDQRYLENASYCREEIQSSSRVFGKKKMEITIDEASSQTSNASYNDDLSKKARVEEIKSEMMKTVSKFYTLKFIKATFLTMIIITITLSVLYIFFLDSLFEDSLSINQLSTEMFFNTFSICNFLSSMISLRSLYEIILNNQNINYNTFTSEINLDKFSNLEKYFNFQLNYSKSESDKIRYQNSFIEYNFTYHMPEESKIFYWDKIDAGYVLPSQEKFQKINYVGYPLVLERNLIESDNLVKSDFFNLNYAKKYNSFNDIPQNIQDRYNFYSHYSVENIYNNIIPHQIRLLNEKNRLFYNYNLNNMQNGINVLLSYCVIYLFLGLIYILNLYLTNRNMELSLQKVAKISLERIEEIIKRIEFFNEKILSKHRSKEKDRESIIHPSYEINEFSNDDQNLKDKNTEKKSELERKYTFNEQKYKSLRILNMSYLQAFFIFAFSCALLFPVYIQSLNMISNSNSFLEMKSFIFGDLIIASINIVMIKCQISNCKVIPNLSFNNTISSVKKQEIIDQIKFYPELEDFYDNKYLLSICDTLYSSSKNISNEYNACHSDPIIKSANNTQALLKYIFDSLFFIDKEISIKKNDINENSGEKINSENLKKALETSYFKEMEYVFYNYIIKLPEVCDKVFILSITNYMDRIRKNILSLIVIFSIFTISFSFYVIFIFVKKIIHLLSISRCILKIIPTVVINKTPELAEWVESKY